MVFIAPFHHHEEQPRTLVSCEDCTHHLPHPGHLSQETGADGCLVCQLLSQVYMPTAGPLVSLLSPDGVTVMGGFTGDVIPCFTPKTSPRAPPVSFCF